MGRKQDLVVEKSGRLKQSSGYILILDKQNSSANRSEYVLEHYAVWEKVYGKIPNGYIIHHLNGVRDDNRIENLSAMSRRDHHRLFIPYQERINQLEQEIRHLKDSDLGKDLDT